MDPMKPIPIPNPL